MEPWSGVLEWILEWNEVKFGVIVVLLGQDLVQIDQFLVNAYFYGALCTRVPLFLLPCVAKCFKQALNIWFIIGRQIWVIQTHILYNVSD